MAQFKVTFLPDNKTVEIAQGKTVFSAAISAGIHINSSCGGSGSCGRCKVILKEGKIESLPTGKITLDEKKKGYYLACLSLPRSDLVVHVPPESRLDSSSLKKEDEYLLKHKEIYIESGYSEKAKASLRKSLFHHSPLATKYYLNLQKPTLKDAASDMERLYRALHSFEGINVLQTSLANVQGMGGILREQDWKVTVTLGRRNNATEVVCIEPGDTSKRNFGIVFDIGTTTISSELIDLNRKESLGSRLAYNKQAAFGSDVITRIIFAREKEGLESLHRVVVDEMNIMIEELVKENAIKLSEVTCCLCAGNTTMTHLLLRVDPTYIRREPYVPTANFMPVISAKEADIRINPQGLLSCVPGVSSYVGGDLTSGALACGIDKSEGLNMLIDIGTNGEIVLGNKDWMMASAASAGPAFEGSGVTCGMRASKGAIQRVKISPKTLEVNYSTIGDARPIGICGSGYIDAIAEMLRSSIIDKGGMISLNIAHKRIRNGEYGKEFVLCFKEDVGANQDIVITEMDIDNLKRAKGAIYSAASILLSHMDLSFDSLDKIFIGGGFGTYLDIKNAIRIGLLADIPESKYVFMGNVSLKGAKEIILSQDAFTNAEDIAKKITYFELSNEPKYMEEYVASLFFPHTDLSKFSNIKS